MVILVGGAPYAVAVGLITIPVVAMANGATKLLDPEPKPAPDADEEAVPAWAVRLFLKKGDSAHLAK